jgi:hypothetical protein
MFAQRSPIGAACGVVGVGWLVLAAGCGLIGGAIMPRLLGGALLAGVPALGLGWLAGDFGRHY